MADLLGQWTNQSDGKFWKARIEAGKQSLKTVIEEGKVNVKRLINKPLTTAPNTPVVRVPADWWYSLSKVAQLFYAVPEVQMTGKTEPSRLTAPIIQSVVNEYLDPEHAHAAACMEEMLMDVCNAVGLACCKVDYKSYTQQIPDESQPPNPDTGEVAMMDVPVAEKFLIDRFPPGYLLKPAEFHGSDYDKADWIGHKFYEYCEQGTPGATNSTDADEDLLTKPASGSSFSSWRREGSCIYFRAACFDPTVKDPDQIRMFEWMKGDPRPRLYQDLPHKNYPGFPVKVLMLHYVSDSATPPSDSSVTRHLVDERSHGRTQALIYRDRTMPQVGYDAMRVTKESLNKIEANEAQSFIGFKGPVDRGMFAEIPKGQMSPENYAFDAVVSRDTDKAWAIGDNQSGVSQETGRTATEAALIQRATDTRLTKEQTRVAEFFIHKIVRPFTALLQQYLDTPGIARVLDDQTQTMQLQQYDNSHLQGSFSFAIKMNSQLRPDAESDQQRFLRFFNLMARSPYMNQIELHRIGCEAFGYNAAKLVTPPPPPHPAPPDIKLSLDLPTLMLAQTDPWLQQLLMSLGVPIPPPPMLGAPMTPGAMPPPAQPLVPGSAPTAPLLNQHAADISGKLPGGGAMMPSAPNAPAAPKGPVH